MKIAICDDNKQELLYINQQIDEYFSSRNAKEKNNMQIFESGLMLLDQIDSGKHFDLYILDIIMPNISGIEIASEIRNKDQVAKIIFITTSSEFAVDSYSVAAFNYLLKPIQKDKFFSTLGRVCDEILNKQDQYIVVKAQTNLFKILLNELMYVEVNVRTLFFHLTNGITIESNNTISQLETLLLEDKRFIKTHRSYIVNLDYIKILTHKSLETENGITIPISRKVFNDVKQAYINLSFQSEN